MTEEQPPRKRSIKDVAIIQGAGRDDIFTMKDQAKIVVVHNKMTHGSKAESDFFPDELIEYMKCNPWFVDEILRNWSMLGHDIKNRVASPQTPQPNHRMSAPPRNPGQLMDYLKRNPLLMNQISLRRQENQQRLSTEISVPLPQTVHSNQRMSEPCGPRPRNPDVLRYPEVTNSSTPSSTSAESLTAGIYNSGGNVKQIYNETQVVISGNNTVAPHEDRNPSAPPPSAAAVAASQIGRLEQYFINSPLFPRGAKDKNCQKHPSANDFGVNFEELLRSGSFGTSNNWSVLKENIVMYNAKPLRQDTDVFRGYQKHIYEVGRDLAIKFVRCTNQSKREIDALLALEYHPNIVKIIDSGKVAGGAVPQIFIALEFCHQNINEYIDGNPKDFAKACLFFEQAVSAVVYIHSKNIIHRDLKPSNILVSWDGRTIKVSDFGISRSIRRDRTRVTVTNAAAGTEGFKAPETYCCNKIGYKSDVFCLGLNGYYFVTHGRHPFGSDPHELAFNIKRNQNLDLSALDSFFPSGNSPKQSQLVALFKAMLAQEPNDRPTAQQVLNDVYFKPY